MAIPKRQIDERMKRFEAAMRQGGLKVTHQRTEIFREVAGSDEHPDAETVYRRVKRRVPAVSQDTVYRTLALLEDKGLVTKAEVLSGAARYDANMDSHHHFVCTRCGLVRDFSSAEMDNVGVPAAVRKIGAVTSRHVQLRGICRGCAARDRKRG